jgi:hypothetical protein
MHRTCHLATEIHSGAEFPGKTRYTVQRRNARRCSLCKIKRKEQTVANEENTDRLEVERKGDSRADLIAIIVVFTMLVLGAVHFISGWTFDF